VSVHVTLVPWIGAAGELKTKPTQHSVKEMREIGIQPDILLCRTERPLSQSIKEKISLFSNVPPGCVIAAMDVGCLYELPLAFHDEKLDEIVCDKLNIWSRQPDMAGWNRVVERFTAPPGAPRASPWWASTCTSGTRTRACTRPSCTAASPTT
jgi:CTP synthase